MAKRESDGTGCESCRFWRGWGHCHRNPPQLVQTVDEQGEDAIDSAISWTALPMWCGEHKPRLQ